MLFFTSRHHLNILLMISFFFFSFKSEALIVARVERVLEKIRIVVINKGAYAGVHADAKVCFWENRERIICGFVKHVEDSMSRVEVPKISRISRKSKAFVHRGKQTKNQQASRDKESTPSGQSEFDIYIGGGGDKSKKAQGEQLRPIGTGLDSKRLIYGRKEPKFKVSPFFVFSPNSVTSASYNLIEYNGTRAVSVGNGSLWLNDESYGAGELAYPITMGGGGEISIASWMLTFGGQYFVYNPITSIDQYDTDGEFLAITDISATNQAAYMTLDVFHSINKDMQIGIGLQFDMSDVIVLTNKNAQDSSEANSSYTPVSEIFYATGQIQALSVLIATRFNLNFVGGFGYFLKGHFLIPAHLFKNELLVEANDTENGQLVSSPVEDFTEALDFKQNQSVLDIKMGLYFAF